MRFAWICRNLVRVGVLQLLLGSLQLSAHRVQQLTFRMGDLLTPAGMPRLHLRRKDLCGNDAKNTCRKLHPLGGLLICIRQEISPVVSWGYDAD